MNVALCFLLLFSAECVISQKDGTYIDNSWNDGFQGHIIFTPKQDVHGWKLRLKFSIPIPQLEIWGATVVSTSADKTEYILTNADYDKDITAGQDVNIGFNGRGTGNLTPTVEFTIMNGGGNTPVVAQTTESQSSTPVFTKTTKIQSSTPVPTQVIKSLSSTYAVIDTTEIQTTARFTAQETTLRSPTTNISTIGTNTTMNITAPILVKGVYINQTWPGGFNGYVVISPNKTIDSWKLHLKFSQPLDMLQSWHANITSVSPDKTEYVLSSNRYNKYIIKGENLTIGFTGRRPGNTPTGTVFGFSGVTPTSNTFTPSSLPPETYTTRNTSSTNVMGTMTTTVGLSTTVSSMQTSDKYTVTVAINVTGTHVNGTSSLKESTGGVIQGTMFIANQTLETTNTTNMTKVPENVTQPSGLGMYVTTELPQGTTLSATPVVHNDTNTKSSSVNPGNTMYDYRKAMSLSIEFYNAQRSGRLPANKSVPWRGDSATNDNGDGHDISGGWYDAGDHMKFNLPMAESAHVLGWGLEKFKDAYKTAGKLDDMYDMLKWPLDYFLKCWIPDKQVYWVQVGDAFEDHNYWGRPEDMTISRPAFKITPGSPGSDVAGNTAAALAVGSIVFYEKDPEYSVKLLHAAKSLYAFAKQYPGLYSNSIPEAKMSYGSSGWKDEMCEAAAELYIATKDPQYLNDARAYYVDRTARVYSWDEKVPGCQLLLWEATQEDQYKSNIEDFINSYMPNGIHHRTPCGLVWIDKYGANRYAANAAFIATIAAANGIGGDKYKEFAMSQINYMLGANSKNFSYEIGYGNNFPKRPHHRGAGCTKDFCANSAQDSPNQLNGALVGGPGENDEYQDRREDYIKNGVACDFNAGFQSACAGLYQFEVQNQLPPSPSAKC